MEPTFVVVLVSLSMFVVSFLAGYFPGVIKDPKVVNLLGILGGGFLMGSALLIILPESVKVLVDANQGTFSESMLM